MTFPIHHQSSARDRLRQDISTLAIIAALAGAQPALAQSTYNPATDPVVIEQNLLWNQGASAPTVVIFNPGGPEINSYNQTVVLQFAPATQITQTTNAYTTEIIGTINGGKPIFDQTFTGALASQTVQNGLSAARLAITTAGGPGVIIGSPTLVSHTVTTSSSASTLYSNAGPNGVLAITTVDTFGPAVLSGGSYVPDPANNSGDIFSDICYLPTSPSTTKPSCIPNTTTKFQVLVGQLNINIDTATTYVIDTTITTTTTTTTADVYNLNGISVQGIGSIHAVVPVAGFDAGEGLLTRALAQASLDDPQRRIRPWVEFYGQSFATPGIGGAPGDMRSGSGIDGGIGLALNRHLVIGAGVDDGTTHLALSDGSATAQMHVTQGVFFARIGADHGLSARLGLGLGGGHADSAGTITGDTALATASEALRTFWLGGEISDPIAVAHGRLILTPLIGAGWTRVHLDGFAETGSYAALTGPAETHQRNRQWAGADAQVPLTTQFSLIAGLRALRYGGDLTPGRSVSFVNYPAVTGLTTSAPPTLRWGAEGNAGAQWRITKAITLYAQGQLRLQDGVNDTSVHVGVSGAF
jgi:hypothetical protein